MSALLTGYFLGAYPSEDASIDLFKKAASDLDILEIGYPSKNPINDGEVIRKAHKEVMSQGCPDLSYWKKLRSVIKKPLWIIAYKEDLIDSGIYRTFADLGLNDVFVLPDCTDIERANLADELAPKGIEVMGFVNPLMPLDYFKKIAVKHKSIYYQLYVGKTGSAGTESDPLPFLEMARTFPGLKIYAGFGIATAEKSRRLMEQGFDGVIIGTAFLNALNESEKALLTLIRDVSAVLKK
ncbi:MAG: tryptophan synthase subunit alpha [Treponema sp.]|nr:tryptophan synthase subunit alpha [Treponema sp.]